jgi:hypothetical protein
MDAFDSNNIAQQSIDSTENNETAKALNNASQSKCPIDREYLAECSSYSLGNSLAASNAVNAVGVYETISTIVVMKECAVFSATCQQSFIVEC